MNEALFWRRPRFLAVAFGLLLATASACTPASSGPSNPDPDSGSCWETVDDYEHPGKGLQAMALAVSPSDEVLAVGARPRLSTEWVIRKGAGASWSSIASGQGFALALLPERSGALTLAGTGPEVDGARQWLMRRSENGTQWDTQDAFGLAPDLTSSPMALATDEGENTYAAGYAYQSPWPEPAGGEGIWWIVRKRGKGSPTWSTVDQHRCVAGGYSTAYAVTATQGSVFVGGACGHGSSTYEGREHHWTVRRSSDGGATWSTVDTLAPAAGGNAWVFDLLAVEGALYAAGSIEEAGVSRWTVRRSRDGGQSWTTVDDFQLNPGQSANAYRMTADGHGRVFVAGSAVVSGALHAWMVRRSDDGGDTWVTDDEFHLQARYPAAALSAVTTSTGEVFVGGWGLEGTSKAEKMLVRRRTCAD